MGLEIFSDVTGSVCGSGGKSRNSYLYQCFIYFLITTAKFISPNIPPLLLITTSTRSPSVIQPFLYYCRRPVIKTRHRSTNANLVRCNPPHDSRLHRLLYPTHKGGFLTPPGGVIYSSILLNLPQLLARAAARKGCPMERLTLLASVLLCISATYQYLFHQSA